jgi:prepilin-type N-terminal cleavage/methylation domain-containing protein
MAKGRRHFTAGFTLVELMVALIVTSIILSAVATLAYATTSAHKATDQMGREQAQLRQVCIRVSDLLRRSNKVYKDISGIKAYEWGVLLCCDMNADGDYLDAGETVWIYRFEDSLRILGQSDEIYTQCKNPTFQYGWEDGRPRSVVIWFDMNDNGQIQRHCINAHFRVSDDY